MLNIKQGSYEYQLLKSFGLTLPRNRMGSTNYEANALTIEPLPVKETVKAGKVDYL